MPEDDFVAVNDAPQYYVSIDPSGKLGWPDNWIDYANVKTHIITVLTKKQAMHIKIT